MVSFRTVVHPWGEAGCALGVRKGRPDVWGDAGEEAVTRARDWWVQAQADLRHAHDALEGKVYEWACFAAQQAGGKALKAVFEQEAKRFGTIRLPGCFRYCVKKAWRYLLRCWTRPECWTSITSPHGIPIAWNRVRPEFYTRKADLFEQAVPDGFPVILAAS